MHFLKVVQTSWQSAFSLVCNDNEGNDKAKLKTPILWILFLHRCRSLVLCSTPLIVSGADDGAGRVGWIISSIDTEKIKDHDNKQ